ncbi:MAG TPA: class I SAM-dependent methyltransferase [Pyrinomonadaceae bacterium]|jgi:SAM-dependent methyltransferase
MTTNNDTDLDWQRYGKEDPYYAVLSADRYRREYLNEQTLEEFFTSGRENIDYILNVIRTQVDPSYRPVRALDFGCGVGRLVTALAANAASVVGVDVSPDMLQEAKRNCAARGLQNVEFVLGDEELSRVEGQFDLITSYIVFQHIPVARGEILFRNLIGHLQEGGVAAVHFTYYTPSAADAEATGNAVARPSGRQLASIPRKIAGKLRSYARGRAAGRTGDGIASWAIQMNSYDLNRLLLILQETGCHNCSLRFTRHASHHGVIFFFQKKRVPEI